MKHMQIHQLPSTYLFYYGSKNKINTKKITLFEILDPCIIS